jgi:hypothetical protein
MRESCHPLLFAMRPFPPKPFPAQAVQFSKGNPIREGEALYDEWHVSLAVVWPHEDAVWRIQDGFCLLSDLRRKLPPAGGSPVHLATHSRLPMCRFENAAPQELLN